MTILVTALAIDCPVCDAKRLQHCFPKRSYFHAERINMAAAMSGADTPSDEDFDRAVDASELV